MELAGKKILIIVGPDFEDREFFYPYYRFLEAGANVSIAGLGEKSYKGKYGVPVEVGGSCAEFSSRGWDAVIIPGGWAPDRIRADQGALEIVRNAAKNGAVLAAICHGGWVLASADVVRGRTVTSFANIKDDLINAGAHWIDEEVVVDGTFITSRKPADLPAFCRETIKALTKAAVGPMH